MTSGNMKLPLETLNNKSKLHTKVEVQTENECSTDEKVIQCCSFKSIKGIIPILIKNKNTDKQLIVTTKKDNQYNLQICQYQTKSEFFNTCGNKSNRQTSCLKRCVIKNDEQMYELAHLLYKTSELLVKLSKYEKRKCVKEGDLRRMVNIVKGDIMKAFLNGKTSHTAMNKIVTRLKYLDDCIKEMFTCLPNNDYNHKNKVNKRIRASKEYESNSETSMKFSEGNSDIEYDFLKSFNRNGNTSSRERQSFLSKDGPRAPPSTEPTTRNNCSPEQQFSANDCNNCHSIEQKLKTSDYCKSCKNKNSINTADLHSKEYLKTSKQVDYIGRRSSSGVRNSSRKIIVGSQDLHKVEEQGTQTGPKSGNNLPGISAAVSYDEFYYNPDEPLPDIEADILWKKRHIPNLNPSDWVQIDDKVRMLEIPPQRLNKEISVQKIKKSYFKDSNGDNIQLTEGDVQTDEILLTENSDYQIVSMNILYSKTHVRYIIPNWMDVDYNIDQTPKVLCKQDLEDGLALTSYKADDDGTIHFTLAYSSDQLNSFINGDHAATKLISKLQEIRGIWAESARVLYDIITKEYKDQALSILPQPNCEQVLGRNLQTSSVYSFRSDSNSVTITNENHDDY